ncbi:hypothetical protein [Geomicrobium sp. JCM 19039]|uniref:hypothetical protein n=1 Tax=Geomicrobium sp. JCM 19039 TaxID=1460636 RepID=UPI001267E419|nr:hypothetical protein [Geomicrobium sp. JCM 19039]
MIIIELQIAIIAAASAILGSIVPQAFAHFSKKSLYKDEIRREYKNNKVKAYDKMSRIIIEMWKSDGDNDKFIWASVYEKRMNEFEITYGIWLDDDEVILLREVQNNLGILRQTKTISSKAAIHYDDLVESVNKLQDLYRERLKKEFYV